MIFLKIFLPIASSKPNETSSSTVPAIVGYTCEVRSSKGVIERVKFMTTINLIACDQCKVNDGL
jgi:hypothetical protein